MKSRKHRILITGLLALVILLTVSSTRLGQAEPGIPDTEDARVIMAVLQRSYDLEVEADTGLGLSRFDTVFINDPRVPLQPATMEFVQRVKAQQGQAVRDDYGFLDYKVAYFENWAGTSLQAEAVEDSSEAEGPLSTPVLRPTLRPRLLDPARSEPKRAVLVFHSIEVKGDLATAVFDDGPRLNEMTLVKRNGAWFIAGWEILAAGA